jgi:hypothetical protein
MSTAVTGWASTRTARVHCRAAGTPDMGTDSPVIPAVPSGSATPAEAAPHRIAAPVETRAVPAVAIPAVIAAAEDELRLFESGRGRQTIQRQSVC